MHEGFVNFNAGTLGTSMVEGRISAGVVVGDGSDVGGGASIMGTLSGGGKEKIRIGERCLLGANAGIGISLGDDCVVEAGLYVTAGTRVRVLGPKDDDGEDTTKIVKAAELSGVPNLLFRRNSTTGAVEVLPRRARPWNSTTPCTPTDSAFASQSARQGRRTGLRRLAVLLLAHAGTGSRRHLHGGVFVQRSETLVSERCTAVVGLADGGTGYGPGGQRLPDHRCRGPARAAATGGQHRPGHRHAGIQAAQHRPRRPGRARFAGPVPAAALPGLGNRGTGHGPSTRRTRSTTPW